MSNNYNCLHICYIKTPKFQGETPTDRPKARWLFQNKVRKTFARKYEINN